MRENYKCMKMLQQVGFERKGEKIKKSWLNGGKAQATRKDFIGEVCQE